MTHSFDKAYWEEIWQSDRAPSMGSSQPNPHLLQEVSDLAPGTALEAGCGAGAEAIWLARSGWQVTAADVSAEALAIAADRAGGVGGQVRWVRADLSAWEPDEQFDLVTTHYAHPTMPQLEFYDRIASWVAPAGTLLIVGHLHHHDDSPTGHGHGDDHGGTGPPGSASVTAAAVTARLDPSVWQIQTAQEVRRTMTGPGGHATSIHDVVVRARRHPAGTQSPQG